MGKLNSKGTKNYTPGYVNSARFKKLEVTRLLNRNFFRRNGFTVQVMNKNLKVITTVSSKNMFNLQINGIITSINGKPITKSSKLNELLEQYSTVKIDSMQVSIEVFDYEIYLPCFM